MKKYNCKLIDFSTLNDQKTIMVLRWRNSDNIRKYMYNSSIISKDDHINYIKKLKLDNNNKYFLIEQNNTNIGVIYFTNINYTLKESEFGLYSNPSLKGVGDILIDTIIDYGFNILHLNKLKAEVFSNNIRAINLYKKYSFNQIGNKIVNKQKVICMELKDENRKI